MRNITTFYIESIFSFFSDFKGKNWPDHVADLRQSEFLFYFNFNSVSQF